MSKAICLYLHVHQPFRIKRYSIFDAGVDHNYFNDDQIDKDTNNRFIIDKVAEKSYLPTNAKLLEMLQTHPEFSLSMSITGTLIEQLEMWRPDVLQSFKDLVQTGRVELVAETFNHSLAFFYSRSEFEIQVEMHKQKIQEVFGQTPVVFRNTELSYNNDLAKWADEAGYKGIIAEGWDPILEWRSPNFVYKPVNTSNIALLMKNYKLSDDIAFRFSNRGWNEWPLTVEKYVHWLNAIPHDQPIINLFMDYETFGEHQWEDTGIFDFLGALPNEFMKHGDDRTFMTLSQAIDQFSPADEISMPNTVTWADTERDLTAWTGNDMQQDTLAMLYKLENDVITSGDWELIHDWRRLQTSDHFYYMCTKWFNDGDVHAYFSPYKTPYEAFIAFTNTIRDMHMRIQTLKGSSHE